MVRFTGWLERAIWVAWATLLAIGLVLLFWLTDREPPFQLLRYETNAPKAGGTLVIVADVRREVARECSVSFSRYLYDSTGTRTDMLSATHMTPGGLAALQKQSPDRWRLNVHIPEGTPEGPARVVTELEYSCNPMHAFWPIQVTTAVEFEVVK